MLIPSRGRRSKCSSSKPTERLTVNRYVHLVGQVPERTWLIRNINVDGTWRLSGTWDVGSIRCYSAV